MRRLFSLLLLMICTMPVWADNLDQLYKAAGWPDQRAHFNDALSAAQQRYRNSLPPAGLPGAGQQQQPALPGPGGGPPRPGAVARTLANPAPALAFFQSPLGRKVVAAELLATRKDQLAKNAKGLPKIQASDNRLLIIGHLAQALPAREAGAEVSLAIAGVAADSLSSMIPGLFGGGQAQSLLDGQRQRLMNQIGEDLNNTLLYVYRDLSDAELEAVRHLRRVAGRQGLQGGPGAVRAGLAVGQNANDLK
jgi:hypothetical protein